MMGTGNRKRTADAAGLGGRDSPESATHGATGYFNDMHLDQDHQQFHYPVPSAQDTIKPDAFPQDGSNMSFEFFLPAVTSTAQAAVANQDLSSPFSTNLTSPPVNANQDGQVAGMMQSNQESSPGSAYQPTTSPSTVTGSSPIVVRRPRGLRTLQPTTRAQTRARRGSTMPEDREFGGFPFEVAGLKVPNDLPERERSLRYGEIDREIHNQQENPPALPPSKIADLTEKPIAEQWCDIPDDADEAEKQRIRDENNRIAQDNQKIERERNNQAAKKSRMKRLEALDNTRRMLNVKTAECNWWRIKAMTLGARASDWETVSRDIKKNQVKQIEDKVEAVHRQQDEQKKRQDAARRNERNRARAAQRKGARLMSSSPGSDI